MPRRDGGKRESHDVRSLREWNVLCWRSRIAVRVVCGGNGAVVDAIVVRVVRCGDVQCIGGRDMRSMRSRV